MYYIDYFTYVNYMYNAFYFLNNFFLCHVTTKRSKPRHEAADETASDTECDAGDDSLM
jgi:hypothetical protein